jgi:uncharacterized membrane protein YfcA
MPERSVEARRISMEWMLTYGIIGLSVGLIAGMLGVGGGGLLVPLLAMVFRYQGFEESHVMHYALGTAFACMIFSSLSSIRAHASRGNVMWSVFSALSAGIVLGTLVTAYLAVDIHSAYIAIFFALFMGFIAVQMFLNWRPKPSNQPFRERSLLIIGLGIGAISAIAAVGGGFLTITYLTYKNIPIKKAIGTSAAIGLPIAAAGAIGYFLSGMSEVANIPYTFGFIYLPAFAIVSITSVLTAPIGAHFAHRLSEAHLKKAFGVLCLLLSIKMLSEFF